MNVPTSRAGRLVLVWEGVEPPLGMLTECQCPGEILFRVEHPVPLYEIGTKGPPSVEDPCLWIGARFGEPTGPAGDPWPTPVGSCVPADAADRFSGSRVRPEQCDEFWLSYFLPDWRRVDQDQNPILIRLALAWAEAMTVSALVDQAASDAVSGADWIVRWRFACWWPRVAEHGDDRQSQIANRAADFLSLLSQRAIETTKSREVLVTDGWPQTDNGVRVWKVNETYSILR